jgi:acetoin utilization deacetylase AcuC-like enzyme
MAYFMADTMTPVYQSTYQDAACAVQNTISLATLAAQKFGIEKNDVYYALNSMPGHHSDQHIPLRGYCAFNNAAFAAKAWQAERSDSKVSIFDLDCHAGCGTQSIFYEDASVLTQSIHMASHEYPSFLGHENEIGAGDGIAYNMNYPCGPRTAWNEYSVRLSSGLERHKKHQAELLIIAFGADTFEDDPDVTNGSGFALTLSDYEKMGKMIADKVRGDSTTILVTQEGGYNMKHVGTIVANFFRGLIA